MGDSPLRMLAAVRSNSAMMPSCYSPSGTTMLPTRYVVCYACAFSYAASALETLERSCGSRASSTHVPVTDYCSAVCQSPVMFVSRHTERTRSLQSPVAHVQPTTRFSWTAVLCSASVLQAKPDWQPLWAVENT